MTARYSAVDLAILGLGASVYISIFVGLSGVLQALSPTIAQLYGAKKFDAIGAEVRQGMWLAIFLSIVGACLLSFPHALIAIAHAPPEMTDKVERYLQILSLALPATLGFRVYASLNTALSRPHNVMLLQIAGLGLKIPLNALFIFGGLGLPAFGSPGCAIATAVSAWIIVLISWLILRKDSFFNQFHILATELIDPDGKLSQRYSSSAYLWACHI